jgi:hypothetical protein
MTTISLGLPQTFHAQLLSTTRALSTGVRPDENSKLFLGTGEMVSVIFVMRLSKIAPTGSRKHSSEWRSSNFFAARRFFEEA